MSWGDWGRGGCGFQMGTKGREGAGKGGAPNWEWSWGLEGAGQGG